MKLVKNLMAFLAIALLAVMASAQTTTTKVSSDSELISGATLARDALRTARDSVDDARLKIEAARAANDAEARNIETAVKKVPDLALSARSDALKAIAARRAELLLAYKRVDQAVEACGCGQVVRKTAAATPATKPVATTNPNPAVVVGSLSTDVAALQARIIALESRLQVTTKITSTEEIFRPGSSSQNMMAIGGSGNTTTADQGDNTCNFTGDGKTWYNSIDGKTLKVFARGEVIDNINLPKEKCGAWYKARGKALAAVMCGFNLPSGAFGDELPLAMVPNKDCPAWIAKRGKELTDKK